MQLGWQRRQSSQAWNLHDSGHLADEEALDFPAPSVALVMHHARPLKFLENPPTNQRVQACASWQGAAQCHLNSYAPVGTGSAISWAGRFAQAFWSCLARVHPEKQNASATHVFVCRLWAPKTPHVKSELEYCG